MLIAPGPGLGVYFFARRYGRDLSLLCRSAGRDCVESLREKKFNRGIPKTLKTMLIDYLKAEQPKVRFETRGMASLTDTEVLALIMGKQDTQQARELLKRFGSLQGIARASQADLIQIAGIGKSKAALLLATFELYRRKSQEELCHRKINSAEAVYQYLGPRLADLDHEVFYVLYLNRNHELKMAKQLFEGGVNATVIDTRIIFKEAVQLLASSIILVHNHPSGNLKPSQADRNITQKCKEAGKLFDIPVLDHVIISSKGYYSFANSGEL